MRKDEKPSKKPIVLDELDQNRSIDQEEYRTKVKEYQLRLLNLQRALMETKHNLIVVVEGPDAAGKAKAHHANFRKEGFGHGCLRLKAKVGGRPAGARGSPIGVSEGGARIYGW